MSGRAAFLDRDGVLVETLMRDGRAHAAVTLAQFRICPEAPAQVARLKAAGLRPIVFTNQPEVARGTLSPGVLDRMHARLRATVGIDDILPSKPQRSRQAAWRSQPHCSRAANCCAEAEWDSEGWHWRRC